MVHMRNKVITGVILELPAQSHTGNSNPVAPDESDTGDGQQDQAEFGITEPTEDQHQDREGGRKNDFTDPMVLVIRWNLGISNRVTSESSDILPCQLNYQERDENVADQFNHA